MQSIARVLVGALLVCGCLVSSHALACFMIALAVMTARMVMGLLVADLIRSVVELDAPDQHWGV